MGKDTTATRSGSSLAARSSSRGEFGDRLRAVTAADRARRRSGHPGAGRRSSRHAAYVAARRVDPHWSRSTVGRGETLTDVLRGVARDRRRPEIEAVAAQAGSG
jgi:hypothetical protein